MNEELKIINNRLIACGLGQAVRISLMNTEINNEAQFRESFQLLTDRFNSYTDLLAAVINCLDNLPHVNIEINERSINILAN